MVLTWPRAYDEDRSVVYAIDDQYRLVKANPAWDTFALENNGGYVRFAKVRDIALFGVIPPVLVKFYMHGLATARHDGRWTHVFNCSSARVIRRLRMNVSVFGDGFLFRNVVLQDALAPASEAQGNFADYGPTVLMCAHCRKVENHRTRTWQWVPEFIEKFPAEVHTRLCPECFAYHYGHGDEGASPAVSA